MATEGISSINLIRLRTVLNASGLQTKNIALYQVINEILGYINAVAEGKHLVGPPGPQGLPGPSPTLNQTFITSSPETGLVNSRVLIAGDNITLDDQNAGELVISGQAGGGGGSGGMEYYGAYVPGTYNDGDVVVWTDGVTYVCTKDGTTTPPEPWPGGGLATADGTFWVVNAHPGLANERVMSSLASGYVKSTNGEPSTVPSIPPGDLPPFIAYTNIKNQFTMAQRISNHSGDIPRLTFTDATGAVNQKTWEINVLSTNLNFWALDDVEGGILGVVSMSRTGALSAPGGLNASQLNIGTVNTARMGSGTANSSTFLRGDNTWQVPSGVPSGAVILFTTPCPAGYTRVAGWDGYYVRMGPSHVAGGATSHTHAVGSYAVPAHDHSNGDLTVASHNHGTVSITGTAASAGNHFHGVSGSISGTTGSSGDQMNVDAGTSGNMSRGNHTHSFGANFSEDTSTTGAHTHSVSGSGGTGNAAPDVTGSTSTHPATAITGASASAPNNPLYIDFYACQKD